MFLTFISINENLKKLRINIYSFKTFRKGLYTLGILIFFMGSITRAQVPASRPGYHPVIVPGPVAAKSVLHKNANNNSIKNRIIVRVFMKYGFGSNRSRNNYRMITWPTCRDLGTGNTPHKKD